jgi:hypothetical protein
MNQFATLSPEDFSRKAWELYREACPSENDIQTFQRAMNIAKRNGLSWIEGMEFAAKFRRGEVEMA